MATESKRSHKRKPFTAPVEGEPVKRTRVRGPNRPRVVIEDEPETAPSSWRVKLGFAALGFLAAVFLLSRRTQSVEGAHTDSLVDGLNALTIVHNKLVAGNKTEHADLHSEIDAVERRVAKIERDTPRTPPAA